MVLGIAEEDGKNGLRVGKHGPAEPLLALIKLLKLVILDRLFGTLVGDIDD